MPSRLWESINSLILMIAFAAPFLYVCSTDYVWHVFSGLSGNVVDTAIALPSGQPVFLLVGLAWLAGFWLFRYRSVAIFRAQMGANMLAVVAFLLIFWVTDTMLAGEILNPFFKPGSPFDLFPEEGLLNLFPIRLALATLLAFACNIGVGKYMEARA